MTSGISAADNRQYIYNTSDLRGALGAKGLESAQIDGVLQEIDGGSIATLKNLGLDGHVAASGAADLPAAEIDAPVLSSATSKASGVNIMDILILMNQVSMELRQANKEVRIAETASSMESSMNAADRIREAGTIGLVVGLISGGVSIAAGSYSMKAAGGQFGGAKSSTMQMKAANTEMNKVKADANLGAAQSKLSTARQNLSDVDELLDNSTTPAAQKSFLQESKTQFSKEVSSLETQVGKLSKTANSANNSQIKSLKNDISTTKKEIKSLEGKTDAVSVQQRTAAQEKLGTLEGELTSCQNMKSVYNDPISRPNANKGGDLADSSNARLADGGATNTRFAQAQAAVDRTNASAAANMPKIQAVGMLAGSSSQVIQSIGNLFTSEVQAEQSELTAMAQMHSAMASESSDYMTTFAETASKALEVLQACLQSQNQASKAIYQNM